MGKHKSIFCFQNPPWNRKDMVRMERSLSYFDIHVMEIYNKIQSLLHRPTLLLFFFYSFLRSKYLNNSEGWQLLAQP